MWGKGSPIGASGASDNAPGLGRDSSAPLTRSRTREELASVIQSQECAVQVTRRNRPSNCTLTNEPGAMRTKTQCDRVQVN